MPHGHGEQPAQDVGDGVEALHGEAELRVIDATDRSERASVVAHDVRVQVDAGENDVVDATVELAVHALRLACNRQQTLTCRSYIYISACTCTYKHRSSHTCYKSRSGDDMTAYRRRDTAGRCRRCRLHTDSSIRC